MKKLIFNTLVLSLFITGCLEKKDDDNEGADTSYRSCYIEDTAVGLGNFRVCYDLGDSGVNHSKVAELCNELQGIPFEGACGADYDKVGSVGLCTGITLITESGDSLSQVKARYYIGANPATNQQAQCVNVDNGSWNYGD